MSCLSFRFSQVLRLPKKVFTTARSQVCKLVLDNLIELSCKFGSLFVYSFFECGPILFH